MNQLFGLHHVSLVTSNAKKNAQFYMNVLGMRMVKKTVNQDDVSVYHLFYADQKGSPGTDLTFFEFPGTMATVKGTNSISRVSLRVPSDQSLTYWINRFDTLNVPHKQVSKLFGHNVLEFEDFDGTPLRFVSDEKNKGVSGGIPWKNGPIPLEHAIYGLGPVSITVSRLALIRSFLIDVLTFREIAEEEDQILFEVGEGGHGAQVIVREDTTHSPERPGYGSVHHVAFRVADRDALNEWIKRMNQTGLPNSGFVDRFYFQSLYVREFNHILFEFATDGPGFATDENEDVLGERLSLPPFLEGQRAFIEQQLEPLN
nr:ring-cleaving dioxygenase [Sporolactobacillus kofuensis]